jgi:hypothetical protein
MSTGPLIPNLEKLIEHTASLKSIQKNGFANEKQRHKKTGEQERTTISSCKPMGAVTM